MTGDGLEGGVWLPFRRDAEKMSVRSRQNHFRKGYEDMLQQGTRECGCPSEYVGVYLRVGDLYDGDDRSLQSQKQTYVEWIERRPGWKCVDFYSDPIPPKGKAVSRLGLRRLMADCREGRITHIVTKSIGTLSVNAEELSGMFRALNSLPMPVGVYFEEERMDTLGKEAIFD